MPPPTPHTRLVEGALLGGVALLPIMRPFQVDVLGAQLIPADVLFAVAGAAWLLSRPIRHLRGAFAIVALAYLGTVLLAVVTSEDTGKSIGRAVIDTYVVGLGLLTYTVVATKGAARRLAGAWLVGTLITASAVAVGLVLYFAGLDTPAENITLRVPGYAPDVLPRFDGLFSSANLMCNFLIVSVAIVGVGWMKGLLPGRTAAALMAGTVWSVALSLSPGIGGAVLALGLAVWLGSKLAVGWRRLALAGAAIVALAFFVAAVDTPRPTVWRQAASAFVDKPILGHGLGVQVVDVDVPGGGALTDAHQTWLSVAVQAGVVGGLALATLIAVLAVGVHRRRPLAAHPAVLIGWCALVGTVLYQGLTMSVEEMRHIWILIGALAGVLWEQPGPPAASAPRST